MNNEKLLEDGKISVEETAEIRAEIFADGKVSREEVEQLFFLKDGAECCPEFKALVVEATIQCVMEDGVISEDEKTWLMGLIQSDDIIDDVEQAIITNLGL